MSRPLAVALALLAAPASAEVPRVVADTPVVHSLVAQVMGELGSPDLLLDRGADPHNFQLRPSQARSLAEAHVVFWVGPELTPWLDRAIDGGGTGAEIVGLLAAEGQALLDYGEGGEEHDGHDDHGHEHAEASEEHGHDHHSGTDPHAWLDPANARVWLATIEQALAEADPENAALYAANAAAARAGIDAIEAEVRATLAPVAGRPIYVYHDAYRYFSRAFGVTVAGTIAEGDAAEPGVASLTALKDEIAAAGTTCVFAEANHDTAYVTNLLEGTGAGTGTLDPDGAALDPGPELYAQALRELATEIAGCLTGSG